MAINGRIERCHSEKYEQSMNSIGIDEVKESEDSICM